MHKNHTNSQNGQSLIIIALMIVGIFGFLGLVLDGGQVFVTRRNSQDAADAAAFAAVRVLALKGTEPAIYNAALDYARANQVITNTDVTVAYLGQNNTQIGIINPASFGSVPNNATGVLVTATIRLQPYFIDLLIGNNPVPIQSVAAAQSGPPSIASDLKPMGIVCPPNDPTNCNFQYGQTVRLFGSDVLGASGSFQWLDFKQTIPTGPNAGKNCSLENYLWQICTSGPVAADRPDTYWGGLSNATLWNNMPPPSPWIANNTGSAQANVIYTLDCWLYPDGMYQNKKHCWTELNLPKPTNRLWTIPVFNHNNGLNGNYAMFHTYLFAEFEFQAYYFPGYGCNYVGLNGNNCVASQAPPSFKSLLTTCESNNDKCIIGAFQKEVKSFQIKPGACNTMGLDVCAYGLSQ